VDVLAQICRDLIHLFLLFAYLYLMIFTILKFIFRIPPYFFLIDLFLSLAFSSQIIPSLLILFQVVFSVPRLLLLACHSQVLIYPTLYIQLLIFSSLIPTFFSPILFQFLFVSFLFLILFSRDFFFPHRHHWFC
jgi:hypothetical protein